MKRPGWLVLVVMIILVLPMVPLNVEMVEGGYPIFRSNILAVWDEWSDVQRSSDQKPMDIEVDTSGRIYIAYQSNRDYYLDSKIVHSDDGGITWSRSSRVDDVLWDGNDTNDQSHQSVPRIAVASNNTVYAVWADHRDERYTKQIRIAWSRDGENFSRSVRIDPHKGEPNWHANYPDIAINDEGRIFVTWLDRIDSGSYANVYGSYSDDGGHTWSPMLLINDDGIHYRQHEYLRCVMHGDDVYITWQDNRGDKQYRPYLSISHDGGETFSTNYALSDDLEQYNSREWPSPAVDDAGNLYVSWRDKRTGSDEIWFTRSEDGGETFSTNVRIAVVPEGADDRYPSTSAFGDGIVGVAFQRLIPSRDTVDEGEIFFINSSNGGRTWDALMRVDDTDRYQNDLTMQANPLVVHDPTGRAVATWEDERYEFTWGSEVYFSSHSGPTDGPNHRPVLYDIDFWSLFEFNPKVGSSKSNITFSCNYSDQDNDVPIEGYPRVHVFSDPQGSEPVIAAPVPMTKVYPNDIDYMDGAYYTTQFKIPYEGQVYYRLEVVEERDDDPVLSPVSSGPLIDATPPKLTVLEPLNMTWYDKETIQVKVRVEDREGGNVRPNTIKVLKSLNGRDNYEKGVILQNRLMIDENTYEAWGNVRFNPGKDNYIKFEAMDRVGNGPGVSQEINVWIDADKPFFTALGPREVQLYEIVNCTVQWMDHLPGSSLETSGLDISSIEYAYRTTSGPLSEWMKPDGKIHIGNGVYQCWVHLEFPDEGVYSFIKWRARDNLSTLEETGEFRINVDVPDNYPPLFVGGAYPEGVVSPTPHLFWDSAFDEDGDKLYYRVMLLRHPGDLQLTYWIDLGERTFYDVTNDKALDPGYYVLRINVTDRIGGYSIKDHIFRIMDFGTPPPRDIPSFGPYYFPDRNRTITWDQSPSHSSMDLHYMIRIGTRDYLGDVLEWQMVGREPRFTLNDLNLTVGMYSIQLMATSNNNYSRVTQGYLKINDYNLSLWSPGEAKSFRGRGRGFSLELTNFGTYQDNVTVYLEKNGGEGYLAFREWVYLDRSGTDTATFSLESQKVYTVPEPTKIDITIFPEEEVEKKDYVVRIWMVSEDGESRMYTDMIIHVTDRPSNNIGEQISDNLYDFLTDTFPFLKGVEQSILVSLFFLLVILLIALISGTGIFVYRKVFRREVKEDPYAKQRKVYLDLYGMEPTKDQIREMVEREKERGSEDDDFFSDIPDIHDAESGPSISRFDETHLRTERPRVLKEEEIEEMEEEEWEEDGGDIEGGYLDPDEV